MNCIIITTNMTRVVLLRFLVIRMELDWRKGRIKIWIVEVVIGVAGGDAALVVAGRVVPVLELLPVHGVLLLALLLGVQGGGVPGDVGVAGVWGVAAAHAGHAHTDLGPGAPHRQAVHAVVVVCVTRLAGRHWEEIIDKFASNVPVSSHLT